MSAMIESSLVIYDDGRGRWGPLTDRRPVFDLRTGAHTTLERIARVLRQPDALVVPSTLADVTAERHPDMNVNPAPAGGTSLLVCGRWSGLDAPVTGAGDLQIIERIAALPPGTMLQQADGAVVAAHLPASEAQRLIDAGYSDLPRNIACQRLDHDVLLTRPWHVLDVLDATLRADLDASALPDARDAPSSGMFIVGDHPVHIAPDATIMPAVVFNSERGPIVIDHNARIEPFVAIEGPCYVGPRAHLAAHTALRAGTSIGPRCKVGGEVKHTIMHGHTNKAHLGYLGDSIVGQWTNLGADTNVSNLKNTYGPVRMQLEADEAVEDTERTNHGPIIGDFVRTAIGTRLLTGSVIGTGAMLALSDLAPKHVDRFTFRTDVGAVVHDFNALLATARTMMALHDVELTDAEAALLRRLYMRTTARIA